MKSEEDKHYMISLICGLLKKDTNELICRTEKDNRHSKSKLMITKEERVCNREGYIRGLGLKYKLLYIE